MNMHVYIMNTLPPVGVPISLRTHNGNDDQYITYFTEDFPELNADDDEQVTGFFVQLDVFSEGNYDYLVEQVKNLMKEAGFSKINFRDDPYSPETGLFHKVMTFSYYE